MSINLKTKAHTYKALTHQSKAKGRGFLVKRRGLTVLFLLFFLFCMNSYAFTQRRDSINNFFGIYERDSVFFLKFSPDGERLSTFWYLWDWKNGVSLQTIAPVVAFSPDNKYYSDLVLRLYDNSNDMILYHLYLISNIFPSCFRSFVFSYRDNFFIYVQPLEDISVIYKMRIGLRHIMGPSVINIFDIKKGKVIEKMYLPKNVPTIFGAHTQVTGIMNTHKYKDLLVVALNYEEQDISLYDVNDWDSLLQKLKNHNSPALKRFWDLLCENTKYIISKWVPGSELHESVKIQIIGSINLDILFDDDLYSPDIFYDLNLSDSEVEKLNYYYTNRYDMEIGEMKKLSRELNRMLLEKVFDKEIQKVPPPPYTEMLVYSLNPLQLKKRFHLMNSYIIDMTSKEDMIVTVNTGKDFFSYPKKITLLDYETGKQRDIHLKGLGEYIALSPDVSLASYLTNDHDKDYWLLRDEEILNWKGVLQKLKQEDEDSVEIIEKMLDSESKVFISKIDVESPLKFQEKKRLIDILNTILTEGRSWFDAKFPYNWEAKLLYYKSTFGISRTSINSFKFNRFLLEDFFSQCIKSKKETAQFTIKVHSLEKDEIIQEIKGGPEFERIIALAISPDNKYLAAGYLGVEDKIGKVHIYEIETGNLIKTLISPYKFSDN